MKHYSEENYCCYPQNNIMDVCKNCARYIENKKDGNYIVIDYRAKGQVTIKTLENGEQSADLYCECHEGNDYHMFKQFDDEIPSAQKQIND